MAAPRLNEINEIRRTYNGEETKDGDEKLWKVGEHIIFAKTLLFSLINRRAVSAVSCAASQSGLPLICS